MLSWLRQYLPFLAWFIDLRHAGVGGCIGRILLVGFVVLLAFLMARQKQPNLERAMFAVAACMWALAEVLCRAGGLSGRIWAAFLAALGIPLALGILIGWIVRGIRHLRKSL